MTRVLHAYLASALTGLSDQARQRVFTISDICAEVSIAVGFELYQPRMITDPVHHPDVADEVVYLTDRARVLSSSIIVMIADEPSTGAGQELAIAKSALLPVVVICASNRRLSRMVTGALSLSDYVIRYNDVHDLRASLTSSLTELSAILRPDTVTQCIALNLARHRKAAKMSINSLSTATAGRVSPAYLRLLEDGADAHTNPSLRELTVISAALGVSVADMVDDC